MNTVNARNLFPSLQVVYYAHNVILRMRQALVCVSPKFVFVTALLLVGVGVWLSTPIHSSPYKDPHTVSQG